MVLGQSKPWSRSASFAETHRAAGVLSHTKPEAILMEAPTCRLCNTKHWSRELCPAQSARVKREGTSLRKAAQELADGPKKKQKQGWDRDLYNAYQRGYMKGLRKGKRVGKAGRRRG